MRQQNTVDGIVKGVCSNASRVLGGSKSKSRRKLVARTLSHFRKEPTGPYCWSFVYRSRISERKTKALHKAKNNLDTVYEEMGFALTTMSQGGNHYEESLKHLAHTAKKSYPLSNEFSTMMWKHTRSCKNAGQWKRLIDDTTRRWSSWRACSPYYKWMWEQGSLCKQSQQHTTFWWFSDNARTDGINVYSAQLEGGYLSQGLFVGCSIYLEEWLDFG